LTLKTKGSEAAARGEDPASLGPAQDQLSGAALALAQQHGSEATTVLNARTCSKFRRDGLLPLFAKANAEINFLPAKALGQVRRLTILTRVFSQMTGELTPDGSLNRLFIKKQDRSVSLLFAHPIHLVLFACIFTIEVLVFF